jgi:CcmD family protein
MMIRLLRFGRDARRVVVIAASSALLLSAGVVSAHAAHAAHAVHAADAAAASQTAAQPPASTPASAQPAAPPTAQPTAPPAAQPTTPPRPAQDEFVPVSDLPESEKLPAAPFLIAAYTIVWLVLLLYVWSLWRRLSQVEQELKRALQTPVQPTQWVGRAH